MNKIKSTKLNVHVLFRTCFLPPTTVVAMIGEERQGGGQAIIAVETQGEFFSYNSNGCI